MCVCGEIALKRKREGGKRYRHESEALKRAILEGRNEGRRKVLRICGEERSRDISIRNGWRVAVSNKSIRADRRKPRPYRKDKIGNDVAWKQASIDQNEIPKFI